VKDVLTRIAREERSHAGFSWDLLEWIVARGDERVRHAVVKVAGTLSGVPRPTAVPVAKASLVAHADPAAMLRHGRIPDHAWAKLWGARVSETRRRVDALLAASTPAPASVVISAGASEVSSASSDMTDCVRM
jgi:hypothetical protein